MKYANFIANRDSSLTVFHFSLQLHCVGLRILKCWKNEFLSVDPVQELNFIDGAGL